MGAYNFQKEFEPAIKNGTKIGTVRARRKNGYLPKSQDVIRLYVGMRTKGCRLIAEVTVRDVVPITINTTDEGQVEVRIATHRLSRNELLAFAKAEGFKSVADFASFFYNKLGPNPSGLYHIRWRDG